MEKKPTPTFDEGLRAAVEKQRADIDVTLICRIMSSKEGETFNTAATLDNAATTPPAPTENWFGISVSPNDREKNWFGISVSSNKPSDR